MPRVRRRAVALNLILIAVGAFAIFSCTRGSLDLGSGGTGTSTGTPSPGSTPTPGQVSLQAGAGGSAAVVSSSSTLVRLTTLTVGTSANECLLAALSLGNPASTGAIVTWGSGGTAQPLTPVTSQSNGTAQVQMLRLIAPTPGSHALVAGWIGLSDAILGAAVVSGADQTTCVGTTATATGVSTTPAVTVSSSNGHLSVAVASASQSIESGTQPLQWNEVTQGAAGPRLRQGVFQTDPSVATATITLSSQPVVGDTLILLGGISSQTLTSVTDPGVPGGFTLATRADAGAGAEIWYGVVASNPASKVTYTAGAAGSAHASLQEWAGLATLDRVSAHGSAQKVPSVAPGSIDSASADIAFLTVCALDPVTTIGQPSGATWSAEGPVVNDGVETQAVWIQSILAGTPLDPSVTFTPVAAADAALASFEIAFSGTSGISSAASAAPGQASVTHQWTTALSRPWAAVAVDILPAK